MLQAAISVPIFHLKLFDYFNAAIPTNASEAQHFVEPKALKTKS